MQGVQCIEYLSQKPQKKRLSFKEQREYEHLEKEIADLEQRKAAVLGQLNNGGHHEQLVWPGLVSLKTSTNKYPKSLTAGLNWQNIFNCD